MVVGLFVKFATAFEVAQGTTICIQRALVLIKDERLPPLQWPLGQIVDVHAWSDGKLWNPRLQFSRHSSTTGGWLFFIYLFFFKINS